ncbi:MAG TPA: ABC transporter permease, partial [Streptosporangiaceae bacterium]|nr:ABC transporter permease [Streptosporangiaceae bacterium]
MPGSRALALTPEQTADPPAAAEAQVSAPQAAASTVAARAGLGRRLLRSKALPRLISPVIVLAAWQAVSSAGLVSAAKLPPPTEVWSTAVSLATTTSAAYGSLGDNMLVSLERVATGFAFGAIVALVLAITAGLSRLGENAVDPLMQMLRTLPLFGLIPVFIVWFGIGELPKILLIAIGVAIPLYLNTFAGIRNVDAKLAELGRVLHLSRRELVTQIVLPGALPQMLVGLRQSLGVGWLALVVAEQFNTSAGLGYMISQATQFSRNDVIFVALLVYCVLGLLTDALVRLLERRALSW